jgi:hypothetical protein
MKNEPKALKPGNIRGVQVLIEIIKKRDIVQEENPIKKNKKNNTSILKNLCGFSVYLGVLKERRCKIILPIKHQAHFLL